MSIQLTSDERGAFERQQFQPLPEAEAQWIERLIKESTEADFAEHRKLNDSLWKQVYIHGEHVKLSQDACASLGFVSPTWGDFPSWVEGRPIDAYAQCIVRYRNEDFRDAEMQRFYDVRQRWVLLENRRDARRLQRHSRGGISRPRSRTRNNIIHNRNTMNTRWTRSGQIRTLPSATAEPQRPQGPFLKVALILSEEFRLALSPETLEDSGS